MPDIRLNRARKNIIVSLAFQIITLICGIIVPRLMLGAFGSEVYGATTSISQFLSYIALLEGGIGGVARAALYRPLAEQDFGTISAIVSEIKRFFQIIALIFVAYVLIIACAFKSISGLECLNWISTFLLVLVISISTLGQYFIGISNSILLQAAQKTYITNYVNICGIVLNAALTVLLIKLNCNIIIVKLVSSFIFAMRPIALWLYVRRCYKLVNVPKREKQYLTQKWTGLGQHIAFFLHSNTDVVILTLFANLKMVAVYSVYNMVVANIQNLSSAFVSGMEALFGDMLAKQEYEQLHKTFGVYETIVSIISVLMFAVTAVMIAPFIRLYTAGITDTNYNEPLFSFLLIIASLLYCIRMPYHSVVVAAGHFKQTRAAAYGEAIINVVISIMLVSACGLEGVAIGTVIATGFRLIYYVVYLSKRIMNRSVLLFIKRAFVNTTAFLLGCIAGKLLISRVSIDGYGIWILCGILAVVVIAIVTLAVNMLFYHEECICFLKRRLSRK